MSGRSSFLGLAPEASAGTAAGAAVVVLPLPYEGTVTWGTGTAGGPAALIEASCEVELYDEVLGYEPCHVGIATAPAPEMPVGAADAIATAQRETAAILARGGWPVVIGGEHSLTAGVFRAVAEQHPDAGVIQLDAHADLRDHYDGTIHSHACVMARVREQTDAVLQLGIRSLSRGEAERIAAEGLAVATMHRLRSGAFDLDAALAALPERVHLTFDVDALDLSLVRATGTPDPGGFRWDEIDGLLRTIFARKRVVSLDVMELCGGDPPSAITVARLVQRMIGLRFPPS